MRAKGISYDTGFVHKGVSSRPLFDPERVARELQIIRDDLHCTAVRLTGGEVERLDLAAGLAAGLGLEVWISPFTSDLPEPAMLALLADCAVRAERLRRQGAAVVLVLGGEISLMNPGFLPGATLEDRLALLSDPPRLRAAMPAVPARVNAFLAQAVATVRAHFAGPITYAAMPFEGVDWTPFDFVALDLYRSAAVADQYRAAIRTLVAQGKPVALTEIGAATYRGAADQGARGGEILDWDPATGQPRGLKGTYLRDEAEQARYLREVLALLGEEGVDSIFVFTFAQYQLPHRADPAADLDLGSYGIVKIYEDRAGTRYPDLPWDPKAAFAALAAIYAG